VAQNQQQQRHQKQAQVINGSFDEM
jgi:hypothetical protein